MRQKYFSYSLLKRFLFIQTVLHLQGGRAIGQPTLSDPKAVCGQTFTLDCDQPGFDKNDGHNWKKDTVKISENGVDVSGTGRYTEISNSTYFALVIPDAVVGDIGSYKCEYAFSPSAAKTLSFTCIGSITAKRDDQDKRLIIDIPSVYPNTSLVTVTITPKGGSPENLTGLLTSTVNGDYFDLKWTSADPVNDENYKLEVTVSGFPTVTLNFGTPATTTSPATASASPTAGATAMTSTTPTPKTTTATLTILTTPTTPESITTPKITTSTSDSTSVTTDTPKTSSITTVHTAIIMSTTRAADSDKGLITMIIVVSVIGGILVIAIIFMVVLLGRWKNCLVQNSPKKQVHHSSHRFVGHSTHQKKSKDNINQGRSENSSFQPHHQPHPESGDHYFYRGVKNPVFVETLYYPYSQDVYSRNAS